MCKGDMNSSSFGLRNAAQENHMCSSTVALLEQQSTRHALSLYYF
jgi:hypothetical protein